MRVKRFKREFGDFQTPQVLADEVCAFLARRGTRPASIIEPNCGRGAFVFACLEHFPAHEAVIGVEINSDYAASLQAALASRNPPAAAKVLGGDFYTTEWKSMLEELKDPLLIIGNPPWVTNSGLGAMGAANLPQKSNFQNHSGLDAITGKGNFDISEWMLIREAEWLSGRTGTLAMLCKTAVARKVLLHVWKNSMLISKSDMYTIDAMNYFGAAVDACLLVCDFAPGSRSTECLIHKEFSEASDGKVGLRDGRLVSDIHAYEQWKADSRRVQSYPYRWRSGIKHDCSKLMELRHVGAFYENGLGEVLDLEPDYLYPMLKSSQLANGFPILSDRWMIVTQKYVGQDTAPIQRLAPKTWEYLQRHEEQFTRRASSIYRKRPRFSIFGVGEYSFAPWKVATSAFYKKLEFKVVPPIAARPVVFDDTCYFIDCRSKEEAEWLSRLLNSEPAREFYNSLIHWDAKRPLTIEILCQLDLSAIASELGLSDIARTTTARPMNLFPIEEAYHRQRL